MLCSEILETQELQADMAAPGMLCTVLPACTATPLCKCYDSTSQAVQGLLSGHTAISTVLPQGSTWHVSCMIACLPALQAAVCPRTQLFGHGSA